MATWRDQTPQVEFRGAKFFLASNDHEGGRSTVVHSFPLSEDPPFVEDLGKKGARFTISGFLVGDQCLAQRDALITELSKPGPGELRHPTMGVRRVAVDSYRTRETNARGGLVEISIDFVETTGEAPLPVSVMSGVSAVTTATDAARTNSIAAFLATYVSVPALNGPAAGVLQTLGGTVNAVLATSSTLAQEAAGLQRQALALVRDSVHLASAPATLAANVATLMRSLGGALQSVGSGLDPVRVFLGVAAVDFGPRPSGTSPRRVQAAENFEAVSNVIREHAIAGAADAAAQAHPVSYEDATSMRDQVTGAIDDYAVAADVGPGVYDGLMATRAALVQSVPGPDSDLPRVVSVTPRSSVPSLVLSHRLYGDVAHEDDLLVRNGVVNPLFVPGGSALEVLSS